MLGANWLSKLGVAAIAVGVAFFLKYAFDVGWIDPTARVVIGLLGAAVMLALGQYLLAKPMYRAYAQVLASGGIIILFLSIYAAYSFYHLIGAAAAFAVLVVAALAASALAAANNTQAVASLCLLGAFATPVLIHREAVGSGDLLRFYAYLAGLNVWSALLVRYRPWHSLTALSFGATWVLFFSAGHLGGRADYLAVESFAVLFLIFACYSGMRTTRALADQAPDRAGLGVAFIVAGCTVFVVASALVLAGIEALGLPALTVVGLATALVLAAIAVAPPKVPKQEAAIRQLFWYLAAGALLLLAAITLAEAPAVSRAQAPAAFSFAVFSFLVFLAVALHTVRRAEGDYPAVALVVANAIAHGMMAFHALAPVRMWGLPAVVLWLPLAGWVSLGALWAAARIGSKGRNFPVAVMIVAQGLPLCALVGAFALADGLPTGRGMVLFLGEFILISATWIGLRPLAVRPGFRGDLLAAFGNAAVFFGLMAATARLASYQGLVLLCGGAIALAAYHAFIGGSVLRRPSDDALHRLTYLGLALTFVTIAIPLQLKASYLTLAWAVESTALVWTGLAVGDRRVRWCGIGLLSVTAVKVLLLDLGRPEPFRLLLNSRMLSGASVIAAAYVCVWLLRRRRDALATERFESTGLALVGSAFTLVFVSLDLWDYLGLRGQLAGRASAQQLSLSIFWSVYALAAMAAGIWRRARPLRLFAMGLLYLSIVKVFVFDLGFLDPAYRIISFIGLGVILLLVSLLYTRFEERLR